MRVSTAVAVIVTFTVALGLTGCTGETTWTDSSANAALLSTKMDASLAKRGLTVDLGANDQNGNPVKVKSTTVAENIKQSSGNHFAPASCVDATGIAIAPLKDLKSSDLLLISRQYKLTTGAASGGDMNYYIRVFNSADLASTFMGHVLQARKDCGSFAVDTASGEHLAISETVTSESGDAGFSDRTSVSGSAAGDFSNVSSWIRSGNMVVAAASSGNGDTAAPGLKAMVAAITAAVKR